jgi:hypothetical protein
VILLSVIIKRDIPRILILIVGLLVLFSYFFNISELSSFASLLGNWTIVIAAWSLLPAAVVLLITHGRNIIKKVKGEWYASIVFIVSFVITSAIGLALSSGSSAFTWIFNNIGVAGYSTMMGVTALYVVSSAYRSLRARSGEAILLLGVAILVMLGNMSAVSAIWPGGFTGVSSWFGSTGNDATQRAINMTVGIGTIGIGLRTLLLGYERRVAK